MNVRLLSPFSCTLLISVSLALVVAAVGRLAGQNVSTTLVVLSREARRVLPITVNGGQEMIALDELASMFQLAVRDDRDALTVSYKGRTIVLTPDQAIASVSGRLISLPSPPIRVANRWLVPIDFISRALLPIYDARLELRRASHLLIVGDLRVPRVTVREELIGNITRVTMEMQPRAPTGITQDGAERLTVKFDADAIDLVLPGGPAQGLVQAFRAADVSSVVVDLAPGFRTFRMSTQVVDTSTRLVLDLLSTQPDTGAPPATTQAEPPSPAELPALSPTGSSIRTLAIDAGHGGDDAGVRGASGAAEKDITLAVARRLKAAVENRLGLRVVMTRDDDRSVPVTDRTALANNNKAEMFVSLHANASFRSAVSGASVYVASFDEGADASLKPADRLPVFGGGLRDLDLVPWNLAQIRHRDQSETFARMLVEQLEGHVPLSARPVDRAPLRVLESANMAAVLIEIGYLTNPDQAKQLIESEFQNVLAQAIVDAIVRFRDAEVPSEGGVR